MLCANLMTVHAMSLLLKETEQLKHLSSTKNSAPNEITTKFKKQCQML